MNKLILHVQHRPNVTDYIITNNTGTYLIFHERILCLLIIKIICVLSFDRQFTHTHTHTHTTTFCTLVVEYWLKLEIAQRVHQEGTSNRCFWKSQYHVYDMDMLNIFLDYTRGIGSWYVTAWTLSVTRILQRKRKTIFLYIYIATYKRKGAT